MANDCCRVHSIDGLSKVNFTIQLARSITEKWNKPQFDDDENLENGETIKRPPYEESALLVRKSGFHIPTKHRHWQYAQTHTVIYTYITCTKPHLLRFHRNRIHEKCVPTTEKNCARFETFMRFTFFPPSHRG